MATIRLIPSVHAVSSTSYLNVANENNMYTNNDSTTYATITNTNASTSSRYLYLRGFNFNSIQSGAEVTDFTVKIKGYESGYLLHLLMHLHLQMELLLFLVLLQVPIFGVLYQQLQSQQEH